MASGHRASARGFVLVLTLWVLAAIAIAAAYFGERVQNTLRLAAARQDIVQAQIALSDGRAEALYRLGTLPLSQAGLGDPPDSIRLDDTPYTDSGGTVQFQETGGLINLNGLPDDVLQRFLASFGVPQARLAPLVDALRDFTDADDLRRLNGAESEQYRAAGRPDLPRNQPLQSPEELRDVLGWAQQPELWQQPSLLDFVTTQGEPGLNPNTAPKQALLALEGVTPDIAQVIIDRRGTERISASWLDRTLGTHYDTLPSPILTFPGRSVRVTQWVGGLAWGQRYNVQLTPQGATAPWKLSYFYRLQRGPDQNSAAQPEPNSPAHASDPPRLPPRPAVAASAPNLLGR